MTRKLISFVACLFTCTCLHVLAAEQVLLRGCLKGGPGNLYLGVPGKTELYRLTGDTAALARYVEREVSLEGSVIESIQPSFSVAGLKRIFDVPHPTLNASFNDSSLWQHETDPKYAVTYAHPPDWTRIADSEGPMVKPNFAANTGAVILGTFEIPRELYAESNLVGGTFGVFINPRITNAQSCAEFGDTDRGTRSSHSAGHIEYRAFVGGGAAAGTSYTDRDFHTFQNSLCYQISFEFAEWTTANLDTGCTIPSLREPDELKIVDQVMGAISFSKPDNPVLPHENSAPVTPKRDRVQSEF